ncbi:TetR/AcrR family transcriptional regulator [Pseudonocardia sp. TRM90224]|uniref:TetR/AcrR family transcriptional regulator n=1 Tax=Pseudonocardia sp. TRM90224 TaxID=2812678 RepID=UPI001E4E86AA|nr:TetR/AcrR family transcriptional regulator [Pseudonocardia sp. TRM90224]
MERSGGGDPRETLRLLWRQGKPRSGRGRPPKITLSTIIAAAISVADGKGVDAMTMDKVAAALDVGTMTLYTHVPGKAELIDLMVDAAWQSLELSDAGSWRAQVTHYAHQTLALHARHPWLRSISTVRPPLGPGLFTRQNHLLAALSETALPPSEATAAVDAIVTFVDAAAATEAEHAQASAVSGEPEDDWWSARQLFWEEIFDPARYPAIARSWAEGGFDRTASEARVNAFDIGLRALLDGINVMAAMAADETHQRESRVSER